MGECRSSRPIAVLGLLNSDAGALGKESFRWSVQHGLAWRHRTRLTYAINSALSMPEKTGGTYNNSFGKHPCFWC